MTAGPRPLPPGVSEEDAVLAALALQSIGTVELVVDALEAWFMFSALQLALRHPDIPANVRRVVEAKARRLQELLSVTPALATVAEAGWDPGQDIPSAEDSP